MKAIVPEQLTWEADGTSVLFNDPNTRVEMLEIAPGAIVEPHSYKEQRVFLCFVRSGGCQLFLAGRLFRPQAGQTFECEPGDVMALHNDTPHVSRVLLTRIGFKDGDRVPLGKQWNELELKP